MVVKSGEYVLTEALNFTAEDAGSGECPITYMAEEEYGAVLESNIID